MKKLIPLILLFLVLFSSNTYALLLTPDNYIYVYFSFNSKPSQNIDVFSYAIHGIDIHTQGLISTSLYDDGQFLASYNNLTQGYTRLFDFTTQDSLYKFNNPTIIDFEPFRNATIKGMFRFSTDIGEFDINPYFSNMLVGTGTAYNSIYSKLSWRPLITSVELKPKVVPEPMSSLLFVSGVILLAALRLTKKKPKS